MTLDVNTHESLLMLCRADFGIRPRRPRSGARRRTTCTSKCHGRRQRRYAPEGGPAPFTALWAEEGEQELPRVSTRCPSAPSSTVNPNPFPGSGRQSVFQSCNIILINSRAFFPVFHLFEKPRLLVYGVIEFVETVGDLHA